MNQIKPPTRVRHELRKRALTVLRTETLSPRMRRIVLGGPELDGFVSLGPDDHVKLFFPPRADGDPVARDYTPRRHDARAGELAIDFVLHGDGPATAWAASAMPGRTLVVGGPRSSLLPPDDDGFMLLVGDETALPAIARRLEEMEAGTPALALIEVADADEERHLPTASAASIRWLRRDGLPPGTPRLLERALESALLPDRPIHVWLAGEIDVVRILRRHLVSERRIPRTFVQAAGYWRRGEAGAHQRIENDETNPNAARLRTRPDRHPRSSARVPAPGPGE